MHQRPSLPPLSNNLVSHGQHGGQFHRLTGIYFFNVLRYLFFISFKKFIFYNMDRWFLLFCRGRSHGGLRMRTKLRKISIQRLLTPFHKCLKMLAKKVNDQNGLAIMFGTTSWNNATCLCIDPNVIQLKRIVCPKKVDVCTLKDPLECMNTLFVWYDFHIKFCINLWLIITSF